MLVVEVLAKRPRSRALLAEIPSVAAEALGCALADVRIYIVDVDTCGRGDDGPCGALVTVRSAHRHDAAFDAIARAVAAVQGDAVEDTVLHWIEVR